MKATIRFALPGIPVSTSRPKRTGCACLAALPSRSQESLMAVEIGFLVVRPAAILRT